MDRNETRALLAKYGLVPNRALGQNFLVDEGVLARILQGTDLTRGVLEIGPGLGALTEGLLAAPAVAAVEIDAAMVRLMRERFALAGNLTLLHEDFLKTELAALLPLLGHAVTVAANLPYYVTTPVCLKLLNWPAAVSMTLMLQKEAAARFFARPGDRVYGPLTVLAVSRCTVEHILDVPPDCYYPQPEVDSVVLRLTRRETPFRPQLATLLERSFAMRRKTLQNNLKGWADPELLRSCGIDPARRAESLTAEEFCRLADALGE